MLPRTLANALNRPHARLALLAGVGSTLAVTGFTTAAFAHDNPTPPPPAVHASAPAAPAKPVPAKPLPAKPVPAPAKPAPAKPLPAKPAPVKAAPVVQAAAKSYSNDLDGWISEARDVLAAHGDRVPSHAAIKARAMTESSGNPKAENHWDSNEAMYGGTYGLIQTIKPTFAAYSLPGHKDILHPVDSIVAGVRYANDRYGSFETIAYTKAGY